MAGGANHTACGFGGSLAAAGRTIIGDARAALADPKLSEAEAVHEVRKALKRWRAFMRLLQHAIGEPAIQMRVEARDLMRSLARARDAQAALDALGDLRKAKNPLSPSSLDTIRKRLTELRDAAEATSFTPEARERLARYLDDATQALERWPLQDIAFETVTEGLTATYRRARRLIPKHWNDADAEHLHKLRRRVVEQRHQMDLIEHLWPRRGKAWAQEAQRLRNQLGACQDLVVLTQFTAPHRPLAPWRSRLAPLIAARRAAHIKNAERIAGRLFAEKPKSFHRRVSALWKAHRPHKR